jgi:GNAT superfamily N-acetyltransferase
MTEQSQRLKIRPAAPLDAANIVRLLKQCWEETGAVQFARVNDQKAMQYVVQTLGMSFVAVAEISGRIVGVLALTPFKEPWSDDVAMAEEWYYVVPSFRSRGAAALLLREAELFCDSQQVPMLFGINASQPRELDEFFARRHGYTYMGGNYMRTPKNGQQENNHDPPD